MKKNQTPAANKRNEFQVAASPFNGVKFALAICLCVALLLWLLLDVLTSDIFWQVIILASYGVLSSLLLVIWTQRVLKQQQKN